MLGNKTILTSLLTILMLSSNSVYSAPFEYRTAKNGYKYIYHAHNESSYQHAHCQACKGIEEYELSDHTRVDCLTDKYAIEYDFANKKYEAVGQALHYGIMTGKQPKIVLILDKKKEKEQFKYYERIKRIGEVYNIEVEYITDDILTIHEQGRCQYMDCKCNKKRYLNTK